MTAKLEPGGRPRGSSTGRSLTAALDLFGRRWTLRILWELREKALGFRALQQHCDEMSSSVLRQRLLELRDAGLVEQRDRDTKWELSRLGYDACAALGGLLHWSERWAAESEGRSVENKEPSRDRRA